MKGKIAVIGVGAVGTAAAQEILSAKLAQELALVDVVDGLAEGKALDLAHLAAAKNIDCRVSGSSNFKLIKGAQVVVVTAGFPRKKGLLRQHLLAKNLGIIKSVAKQVKKHAPNAIVIITTNPLDLMVYAFIKTGFSPKKVVGMAGALDSARFRHYISLELKVDVKQVKAMVIGPHAAQLMLPLTRLAKVKGRPLEKKLSAKRLAKVVEQTRQAGKSIAHLFGSGTAFLCPGAAAAEMASSILKNKNRVFPCSVLLRGDYGLNEVCLGLPVKLGKKGVTEKVKLRLNHDERCQLQAGARVLKESLAKL
jgi:malate dehydrogenase